jgi:hypothetical protein
VKFPFRAREVAPSPGHASTRIWRPIVPIRVFGPAGIRLAFGLLDTGADETKLPMELAKPLGISIDTAEPARFLGIAGQQAKGFYGRDVGFELRQNKRSYRWIVRRIAFLYDYAEAPDEERITITLGNVGFFRFFNTDFDYQRGRVSIRPNGLFRQHAG